MTMSICLSRISGAPTSLPRINPAHKGTQSTLPKGTCS